MTFLLITLAALVAFFTLAYVLEWGLIDDIARLRKRIWREWSTRFQMAGLASYITMLPIDPVTGLSLWNMLPLAVHRLVPQWVLIAVGLTLFVLAWLSKYVKQAKLHE